MNRRWYDAIHFRPDEFERFWRERLSVPRNLLLILGSGWDPRMTTTAGALRSFGGEGNRDLHVIRYSPSRAFQSPYQVFIDKNLQCLGEIAGTWGTITEISIDTRKEGNRYVGDDSISIEYRDFDLSLYSDIVVDISSLPKSLYFPLLLILVKKSQSGNEVTNIHVAACQDPKLDSQIIESSDDTRLIKGFRGGLSMISKQDIRRIWVPMLGKNCAISFRKLYDFHDLSPADIYPVLPFPSRNPRTDDDLLLEYRHFFVDQWQLNPMNIIYAAEDDPLDVYRRLLSLYRQQKEALEPLGGVTMVISPLSSKLSSIGAFMAAYEVEMAVAHSIGRHEPPESMGQNYWDTTHMSHFERNLHSIWLTGEPYVEY